MRTFSRDERRSVLTKLLKRLEDKDLGQSTDDEQLERDTSNNNGTHSHSPCSPIREGAEHPQPPPLPPRAPVAVRHKLSNQSCSVTSDDSNSSDFEQFVPPPPTKHSRKRFVSDSTASAATTRMYVSHDYFTSSSLPEGSFVRTVDDHRTENSMNSSNEVTRRVGGGGVGLYQQYRREGRNLLEMVSPNPRPPVPPRPDIHVDADRNGESTRVDSDDNTGGTLIDSSYTSFWHHRRGSSNAEQPNPVEEEDDNYLDPSEIANSYFVNKKRLVYGPLQSVVQYSNDDLSSAKDYITLLDREPATATSTTEFFERPDSSQSGYLTDEGSLDSVKILPLGYPMRASHQRNTYASIEDLQSEEASSVVSEGLGVFNVCRLPESSEQPTWTIGIEEEALSTCPIEIPKEKKGRKKPKPLPRKKPSVTESSAQTAEMLHVGVSLCSLALFAPYYCET